MQDKEDDLTIREEIDELRESLDSLKKEVETNREKMEESLLRISEFESGVASPTLDKEIINRLESLEQRFAEISLYPKTTGRWANLDEFMEDEMNQLFIEKYCSERNWNIKELGHKEKKELYIAKTKR